MEYYNRVKAVSAHGSYYAKLINNPINKNAGKGAQVLDLQLKHKSDYFKKQAHMHRQEQDVP